MDNVILLGGGGSEGGVKVRPPGGQQVGGDGTEPGRPGQAAARRHQRRQLRRCHPLRRAHLLRIGPHLPAAGKPWGCVLPPFAPLSHSATPAGGLKPGGCVPSSPLAHLEFSRTCPSRRNPRLCPPNRPAAPPTPRPLPRRTPGAVSHLTTCHGHPAEA